MYKGSAQRDGEFGQYTVYVFEKPNGQIASVSGCIMDAAFSTGQITPGAEVQVVFKDWKPCSNGEHQYRLFEVYTREVVAAAIAS